MMSGGCIRTLYIGISSRVLYHCAAAAGPIHNNLKKTFGPRQ